MAAGFGATLTPSRGLALKHKRQDPDSCSCCSCCSRFRLGGLCQADHRLGHLKLSRAWLHVAYSLCRPDLRGSPAELGYQGLAQGAQHTDTETVALCHRSRRSLCKCNLVGAIRRPEALQRLGLHISPPKASLSLSVGGLLRCRHIWSTAENGDVGLPRRQLAAILSQSPDPQRV